MSFVVKTLNQFEFDQPFTLNGGGGLPSFNLTYETYGQLNKNKTNAVLVCHALSASHHVAGYYHDDPKNLGWWDSFVGPNKTIDTNKFYVIGLNNLGGCHGSTGPSSTNPQTNKKYANSFPMVTVKDWVKSQELFANYLGIEKFAAIVGGSLGGMQALQWAIDYPDRIENAVIIAATPKLSAQNIAFNDIARQAIINDPEFYNGDYYSHNTVPRHGLRVARMMGHITYLSDFKLTEKFGRTRRDQEFKYSYDIEFEIESYLRYQGEKFANYFDANTYLLMTKALDYFDPASEYNNSLQTALKKATAKFLVLTFNSDWRFNPIRSWEMVSAMLENDLDVSYCAINSESGHDSFLLPDQNYMDILKAYFNNISI